MLGTRGLGSGSPADFLLDESGKSGVQDQGCHPRGEVLEPPPVVVAVHGPDLSPPLTPPECECALEVGVSRSCGRTVALPRLEQSGRGLHPTLGSGGHNSEGHEAAPGRLRTQGVFINSYIINF